MRFSIIPFVILLTLSVLAGCAQTQLTHRNSSSPNSIRYATNWSGTYHGRLPCESCIGLKTILTLHLNGTYIETMSSALRPETIYINEGRFIWNKRGDKITLSNGHEYKVAQDWVVRLDTEKQDIPSQRLPNKKISNQKNDSRSMIKDNGFMVEDHVLWKQKDKRQLQLDINTK